MEFDTVRGTWNVRWQFVKGDISTLDLKTGRLSTYKQRDICLCTVRNTFGTSITHATWRKPSDPVNNDKARKESLAKVLHEMGLSKDDRADIWEIYRTMTDIARW